MTIETGKIGTICNFRSFILSGTFCSSGRDQHFSLTNGYSALICSLNSGFHVRNFGNLWYSFQFGPNYLLFTNPLTTNDFIINAQMWHLEIELSRTWHSRKNLIDGVNEWNAVSRVLFRDTLHIRRNKTTIWRWYSSLGLKTNFNNLLSVC